MIENAWNAIVGAFNWNLRSLYFDVPWYNNYLWGLVLISALVYAGELLFPWRKRQAKIRQDFWLDLGWMFFNFVVFAIAVSGFYSLFRDTLKAVGLPLETFVLFDMSSLPAAVQLIIFFIISDFVQWFTHVLLHRYPILWNFHKVHHSVKEMGFAAHFRYHWMENILYKPLKTMAVMVLGGFEPEQAYIVHFAAIAIGHLNHANIRLTYGPLKYIFNNPVMHLHHHRKALPESHKDGVNFGISLSLWDYLFKTAYIPDEDPYTELGFPEDEKFPKDFAHQFTYGLVPRRKDKGDSGTRMAPGKPAQV